MFLLNYPPGRIVPEMMDRLTLSIYAILYGD